MFHKFTRQRKSTTKCFFFSENRSATLNRVRSPNKPSGEKTGPTIGILPGIFFKELLLQVVPLSFIQSHPSRDSCLHTNELFSTGQSLLPIRSFFCVLAYIRQAQIHIVWLIMVRHSFYHFFSPLDGTQIRQWQKCDSGKWVGYGACRGKVTFSSESFSKHWDGSPSLAVARCMIEWFTQCLAGALVYLSSYSGFLWSHNEFSPTGHLLYLRAKLNNVQNFHDHGTLTSLRKPAAPLPSAYSRHTFRGRDMSTGTLIPRR